MPTQNSAMAEISLDVLREAPLSASGVPVFELSTIAIRAASEGAAIRMGISHPHYEFSTEVAQKTATLLAVDFT